VQDALVGGAVAEEGDRHAALAFRRHGGARRGRLLRRIRQPDARGQKESDMNLDMQSILVLIVVGGIAGWLAWRYYLTPAQKRRFQSKPKPKAPAAKAVNDCRFLKEEDERLTCFNGFADKIPKLPR